MKKILSIGFIFMLLVSCNSQTDKKDESQNDTPEQTTSLSEKTESEIEKRIAETDMNDKLDEINSLYFTKEDGSSLDVKALVDKSEAILKVEERFADKSKDEYGTIVFYVHNGKKYASKERFEEKTQSSTNFVERVSFYDSNEKVINTKIRKAHFEEELDAQTFQKVALKDCSITTAMDALNMEGDFETRFQGFVTSGRDTYITVGKSEDGYISALLLQYQNSTTLKLMNNPKAFMGLKLDLEFQKMVDKSGFEFRVLLTVKEAQ